MAAGTWLGKGTIAGRWVWASPEDARPGFPACRLRAGPDRSGKLGQLEASRELLELPPLPFQSRSDWLHRRPSLRRRPLIGQTLASVLGAPGPAM